MSTKTFHGSCHCGAVRFEVDLDLAKGTGKCNCTFCWKVRNWTGRVEPAAFRVVAGADQLGDYSHSEAGHHCFCKTCGVRTHTWGDLPQVGGKYVSVSVSALDDLPVDDLVAAPLHYMDGRHDDWAHAPAETRHL